MSKLLSIAGLCIILLFSVLISNDRKSINKKMIVTGLILEFILALAVLKISFVESFFNVIGAGVNQLFLFTGQGSSFLFGSLLDTKKTGFIFAFQILPTIVFISAFMSILYYYNIMQTLIKYLGVAVKKLLNTSGAETMNAVANIFVGQTEAPLFVRPYIPSMTRSEITAMMIAGMGSISVGAMAGYVGLGISAKHLITASVMSAPASLIISKILYPETEKPATLGKIEITSEQKHRTVIEAFSEATSQGLSLALNVGAMLLTFLALIALVNSLLTTLGGFIGISDLNLSWILGRLFAPLAFILGIPANEILLAGNLLGQKLVMNEFVAYISLGDAIKSGALSPRTITIMTYALCGFANISSIGIQLGGIGGLAPERKSDIAQLGIKALIGGTLVTLMNAAIIGILI